MLELLTYKNERAMSFEKFSSKLQLALEILTDCDWPPHNGDIVDMIWEKIQNTEVNAFINALKAQQYINPREYTLILQDIASKVLNLSQKPFYRSNISETNRHKGSNRYGPCRRKGAFTSDGQLFVEKYSKENWNSTNEVKKYHRQIFYARENVQSDNRHPGFKNNR